MGKRSTWERGVINQQKRLKSLGKAVCCLRIRREKIRAGYRYGCASSGRRGKKATCGGAQPCHLTTVCVYGRNGLGKRSFKTAKLLPSWETTGSKVLLLQQWLWSQPGNARWKHFWKIKLRKNVYTDPARSFTERFKYQPHAESQGLIKWCKRIYGDCQLWRDAKENNLLAYLKALLISAFVSRLLSSEDEAMSSSSSLFDFSGSTIVLSLFLLNFA